MKQLLEKRTQELAAISERLSRILEAVPNALIIVNQEGRITMANSQAEKLFGYPLAELLEQPIEMLVPERFRAAHPGHRTAYFANPSTRAMGAGRDLFGQRKDGSEVPIEIGLNPFVTSEGAFVLASIIDITERKHAEAQVRQLSRAVEQSPVAIIITDPAGVIEYVNPKFIEVTGYTLGEVLGQNPRFLKSGYTSPEAYRELWQTISAGKEWRGEFHNKKKNGELFWESASISPIRDASGGITHFVAVKEDITLRKQLEVDLHTKAEQLEQSEKLLRARNEELKGFAYTVSHDLKAPLRGIAGYAQELERRHKAGLTERAQFCITQILTATRNLDELIEDLLHYARLDAETPSATAVHLPGLVDAILKDRSLIIADQHVEVTVDLLVTTLRTWERGLEQVLTNLIDNALKYSRQASPPRVGIRAEALGNVWRLAISDNGIGFDMKYHDRIFGLFNRLVRAEDFEGTGAGLAIVKKVLDKQGGRIWAQSGLGQGTTFYVELPK